MKKVVYGIEEEGLSKIDAETLRAIARNTNITKLKKLKVNSFHFGDGDDNPPPTDAESIVCSLLLRSTHLQAFETAALVDGIVDVRCSA